MAAKKKSAKKKTAKKKTAKKKTARQKPAKAKAAKAKPATKKAKPATKPSAKVTKAAKPSSSAKPAPEKQTAKVRIADLAKVAKIGPRPTTTIVQHVFIQATPEQVYDALVEPTLAATVIGAECRGEPKVGADFQQWNGYINGRHQELVRGERIVQEWSTTEWPKGASPSRLEISLAGTGGGTELTMTHSSVPTEQAEDYRQGWIDNYWTPMRAHFGG